MKKIIIFVIVYLMFSLNASAQIVTKDTINAEKQLKRVTTIGQKLLSANNLPTKIAFYISDEEEINAYANIDNEVHVYSGLLNLVETDDELAAVISHEIGHIANRHIQKQTILSIIARSITGMFKKPVVSKVASGVEGLSMLKVSRSAEYEADLTGADLMIGANYNPQGMLSLLNKIAQNFIDVIQTHPSGNKRLVNVYDYLSFNYPETIEKDYDTDSYMSFKIYIDQIIRERNSNPKKMQEYTKKQTKLRNEKLKRAKSIQKESNVWASAYNVIQSTAKFQNNQ